MADTPDDLLAEARKAVADYLECPTRTPTLPGHRVCVAFASLDILLSSGGPLPTAWVDCTPVRPVTDVPGPDIAADVREAQRRIEAGEIADTWAPDVSERAALVSGLAAALRSMTEKGAEISRLTAELDAARNAPVEYVITAGLQAAMSADPHREDGTVLKCTDGAKRSFVWKAATREWEPGQ